MDAQVLFECQWPFLLSFVPSADELERTARVTGALRRKRQVSSASALLRLALAYGFCGFTLRQTAAWAEVAGVASLSDVALLKRLRGASDWLGLLLSLKLAERAPPPLRVRGALRLRLVDATTISRPGSQGTDWRVHMGYDLNSWAIDHIEVTDVRGGETLVRFPLREGDLVVGDRGYAHRRGLHAVVAAGAHFLIRLNWQNVPLTHPSGDPFDLLEALRSLAEVEAAGFDVCTKASPKDGVPPIAARLVAIRKTEVAAEAARRKVLQERAKKGRKVDPRTLEAAGYIFVLTSLSADTLSAEEALDLYRFRWQIELAFKRMKSLLQLGNLPARDPPLARSFLYAKLLAALLLEDFTDEFLAFSPWGHRLARVTTVAMAYPEGPAR
ncbi:MAG: IS4 family transposase [Planctomycetes bacterium]|nr:IS4 family transposase [Planctomycetota bacterium]